MSLFEIFDKLTRHLQEHDGVLRLSVKREDAGSGNVWTAQITNDMGTFIRTCYDPIEAMKHLIEMVKA